MKNLILLIGIISLLSGCQKDSELIYSTYDKYSTADVKTPDTAGFPMKILWHTQVADPVNYAGYTPSHHIMTADNYIQVHVGTSGPETMLRLDKNTGEVISSPAVPLPYIMERLQHPRLGTVVFGNRSIVIIDDNGLSTTLYQTTGDISNSASIRDDDLYFTENDPCDTIVDLVKLDLVTGSTEILLHINANENGMKRNYIGLPVFLEYLGHTLTLTQISSRNGDWDEPYITTQLTSGEAGIQWQRDDLPWLRPEMVEDGTLVSIGDYTITKIDVLNGEVIWQKPLQKNPDHYMSYFGGHQVRIGHKLYDLWQGRLTELDLLTGDVNYHPRNLFLSDTQYSPLAHHNGYLYWTTSGYETGKLYALNLANREVKVEASSPYYAVPPFGSAARFSQQELEINPTNSTAIITDGFFIYCLKLL